MSQSTDTSPPACRRIQVSREKRPLNFFVSLSKKFLTTDQTIELSGLGLAVTTVVTIAEILRTDGLVSIEHIQTSLVEAHPDSRTSAPKAKIQIWIHKTPQFDSLITNHNSTTSPSRPRTSVGANVPSTSPPPSSDPQLEPQSTNPPAETDPVVEAQVQAPEEGSDPHTTNNLPLEALHDST